MNQAQKTLDERQKRKADHREKDEDKVRLAKDLLNFEYDMINQLKRRNQSKKFIKSELNVAMKHKEDMKQTDKMNTAIMDQLQKNGPPMMQEIEFNQMKLDDKTKQVNKIQGVDNFALMISQRRKVQQQKEDDLAEY